MLLRIVYWMMCLDTDVLVLYGPSKSETTWRNGYTSVLLAEKMIAEIPEFKTIGLCSHSNDQNYINQYREILDILGCCNCQLIDRLSFDNFIRLLSKTKVVIDLDMSYGAGKIAVECAVLRKPIIVSNCVTSANDIYGDMRIHHPLNIDSMMDTARFIADGYWGQSWLDIAYERAQKYSIENLALLLEKAVI